MRRGSKVASQRNLTLIKTGGKQYKMVPGQTLKIEKLFDEPDAKEEGSGLNVSRKLLTDFIKYATLILVNRQYFVI